MWGELSAPARCAQFWPGSFAILLKGGSSGLPFSPLERAPESLLALKLLWWAADKSFVQRSALITGLSLALGGLTLVGLGEWAAGRFETTMPEGRSPASVGSPSSGGVAGKFDPTPLPDLPDTSDHLPGNAPAYTFRHDVPEVRLQFTVADQGGKLVSDLSSSDVHVFDNQTEVPRFNAFERNENLPLQIGLVLDTSDSVKRILPREKKAAVDFLQSVMRPQGDSAFVVAFGGDVKTWQTPTSDRQQLVNAIARLHEPAWGTRVYDALYAACSSPPAASGEGTALHRAIILLSDGDDTDSLHSLDDVIAAAQRAEVQIYPLTIHASKVLHRGDRVLQHLADGSGGRFYVAASAQELGAAFSQIEQDLRTQYLLSFSPSQQSEPGFHSLRIEVRTPQKLQVRARQGYYAMAQ
jgi:Ca-activated chloride channel homolog